ncbi:protein CSN12 [Thozetella sp. PMI_491]|nr:protein CSN12 [Thozetella sp. PMI_491]
MDTIFEEFRAAHSNSNGYRLSKTLSPELSNDMLRVIWRSLNYHDAKGVLKKGIQITGSGFDRLPSEQVQGWVDIYFAYWKSVGELLAILELSSANGKSPSGASKPSWTKVYETWKELCIALQRGYTNHGFEAWTIPCLYVAGKHLRIFAIKADEERNQSNSDDVVMGDSFQDDFDLETERNQQLEDCARQLNKIFTLCANDRAPLEDSRKWGIYYVIGLLFKTYFKLNKASLSKNVLKLVSAGRGDMPSLESFPKSQQVTVKYYEGVLDFLEEHYERAEEHFTRAWNLCHKAAQKNKELILIYLIPCRLLTTHTLPTNELLEPYPRLQKLFLPLVQCIRKGDLFNFDRTLQEGEDEFIKRRIYLTLERGRDIAMRNLFRKVFIAGGFEEQKEADAKPVRRTRIPIAEFVAAVRLSGQDEAIDSDEVECLLANMIYKVSNVIALTLSPYRWCDTRPPVALAIRRVGGGGCKARISLAPSASPLASMSLFLRPWSLPWAPRHSF